MKLILASISSRKGRGKSDAADAIVREFVDRASRYIPTEALIFEDEARLLAGIERKPGTAAATLVAFDSRGELVTSEQFAHTLRRLRDSGAQRIVYAIGPADGWSAATLACAEQTVSFGRMTLPHELARAIMAEQVYRALTILAGHPYHSGH